MRPILPRRDIITSSAKLTNERQRLDRGFTLGTQVQIELVAATRCWLCTLRHSLVEMGLGLVQQQFGWQLNYDFHTLASTILDPPEIDLDRIYLAANYNQFLNIQLKVCLILPSWRCPKMNCGSSEGNPKMNYITIKFQYSGFVWGKTAVVVGDDR